MVKNLNQGQGQKGGHAVQRILLYKPDESITPTAEMALRNVGYTVVPGINPNNFIYEVKTATPDLIILGLGAGLEEMLIERVRAKSDVMIIALASPARIASGEPPPAEVQTWLPKPIDSRSLLWAVKNLSPQAVRT